MWDALKLVTLGEFWDLSLTPGDVAGRLGLAILFGALIGWERQNRHKHADIRTMVLVSLGAALFVVAAEEVAASPSRFTEQVSLLAPVLGGVVGGVGFLGAGAIMHQDSRVEGVTTAAAIWVTAGIGVTCGLGEFALSIMAGLSVLLTLVASSRLGPKR